MKKMAQTILTAEQYYTIANTSGKVIEGVESKENGAAVQLANYTHSENQQWAFVRMGEGVYRIQNRGTGKMLDLMMGGTADGTWLHQWEDANGSSQMWIVEPTNDGRVKIKTQLAPAKCVDVVGMSSETGARLQIWQDVNGDNQLWKISEAAEKKTRAPRKAAEKAPKAAAKTAKPTAKKATSAAKATPKAKAAAATKAPKATASAPAAKAEPTAKKAHGAPFAVKKH